MKKFWVTLLLAILLTGLASVQAQEKLEPGTPIEGSITADATAVEYTYDAAEGELVVIQLFPVDVLADYDRPAIQILDADGSEVLLREGFGATTAFWQFDEASTYTIVATRADDTSVGDYTLTLITPEALEIGDVIESSTDNDTAQFYSYSGDEDFLVFFARDGDYAPEISVNTVDKDVVPGRLQALGYLGGAMVNEGAMGTFMGGTDYILAIDEALFDVTFGTATADYILEIVAADEEID